MDKTEFSKSNNSKFRILMLHGYESSASDFLIKTNHITQRINELVDPSILNEFPEGIEFLYPNATVVLEPPIGFDRYPTRQDEEQYIRNAISGSYNSDATSLAWWYGLDVTSRYRGIENSLSFLANYIHGQPIHGVIGFSQGACLGAMVTSLLECIGNPEKAAAIRAQNLPVEDYLGLQDQQPLRLFIGMGGYRGTPQYYGSLYSGKMNTPSCHTLASLDILVDNFRTLELAHSFTSYKLVHYYGCHYVPRSHAAVEELAHFVLKNSLRIHSDNIQRISETGDAQIIFPGSHKSVKNSQCQRGLVRPRVHPRRRGILWEIYLR